jgi:hypothetical protein
VEDVSRFVAGSIAASRSGACGIGVARQACSAFWCGAVWTACGRLAGFLLCVGVQRQHWRLGHRVGDDAVLGMRPFRPPIYVQRYYMFMYAHARINTHTHAHIRICVGVCHARCMIANRMTAAAALAASAWHGKGGRPVVRCGVDRVWSARRRLTMRKRSTPTSAAGTPRR